MNSIEDISIKECEDLLIKAGANVELLKFASKHLKRSVSPNPDEYFSLNNLRKHLLWQGFPNVINSSDGVHKSGYTIVNKLLEDKSFPIYYLDKNLAEDFLETDLPQQCTKNWVLPAYGVILLPEQTLNTDTGDLKYIMYRITQPNETAWNNRINGTLILPFDEPIQFNKPSALNLHWFGGEQLYSYGGVASFYPNGNILEKVAERQFVEGLTEQEIKEQAKVLSLLMNCLIYSSSDKALIDQRSLETTGGGFGRSTKKVKRAEKPLFIGRGYQSAYKSIRSSSGTGSSKRPHHRKGHYRLQRYGKGNTKQKTIFIQPTKINF